MQTTRRRLAAVLPLVTVLTLAGVAATTPFPPDDLLIAYNAAREWVDSNRYDLPKTLESISKLPMEHRKAVVAALTVAERESVWREHLESFVKPNGERTATQRRIVASLGDTLTSAEIAFVKATLDSLHAGFSGDTAKFGLATCARMKQLFPRALGAKIFRQIGPATAASAVNEAGLVSGFAQTMRTAAVKLGLRRGWPPSCTCALGSLCDCPDKQTCVYSDCFPHGGCGCFGFFQCEGRSCFAES